MSFPLIVDMEDSNKSLRKIKNVLRIAKRGTRGYGKEKSCFNLFDDDALASDSEVPTPPPHLCFFQ